MKTFINKFEIMRNAFLLFALFNISAVLLYSQTNTFPSIGNVGIGTSDPSAKFDVRCDGTSGWSGRLAFSNSLADKQVFLGTYNSNSIIASHNFGLNAWTSLFVNSALVGSNIDGGNVIMSGNVGIGTTDPSAKLDIRCNGTTGWAGRLAFSNELADKQIFLGTYNSTAILACHNFALNAWETLYVNSAFTGSTIDGGNVIMKGNVGIGTTSPDYKLDVVGTIRAHHLKLNLDKAADYVFANDYKLLTLSEVDKFIQENKHLPGVPSAAEFKKNGLEVSEMSNLMLQKMEELTLYIIAQDKKLKEQEVKYQELLQKVELLNNNK